MHLHPADTEKRVTFLSMSMTAATRWNFLCEATNAAFLGTFIGIVGPFTLPLAIRMGASSLEVGLIAAAPFLANLLSAVWARLSHNARKLPWVVGTHVIWRGSMALVGLVKSPAAITAISLTSNAAIAAANPAYGALVQKVFPAPIRGRLMGYVRLILAAFMLPMILTAGQLMDRFGPGWLYPAAALLGLLGVTAYAFTREPVDGPPPSGPLAKPGAIAGIRLALSDPQFRGFLLAAMLFHGGVLVAQPLYSVFQVKQMGLSNVAISYLAVAWNVAWLTGFALWGRVIDRKGPRPVVIGAAFFFLGLPLAYGLGGGNYALAILGAMCQGLAESAMDLGGWNLILSNHSERVGPYTSASMTLLGVRGALGPLLGSWLLQVAGFQITFLMAAALIATGLVLFLAGRQQPLPRGAY